MGHGVTKIELKSGDSNLKAIQQIDLPQGHRGFERFSGSVVICM